MAKRNKNIGVYRELAAAEKALKITPTLKNRRWVKAASMAVRVYEQSVR